MEQKERYCEYCGNKLIRTIGYTDYLFSKKRFCNQSCGARNRIEKGYGHIFKTGHIVKPQTKKKLSSAKMGNKNPMWKGGRTYSDGYIRLTTIKGHPFEHRYLMEQKIGRKLKRKESVHHINGIKDDNRLDNLIVISGSDHQSLHHKGKKYSDETKRKISTSKLKWYKENQVKQSTREKLKEKTTKYWENKKCVRHTTEPNSKII